jgi:hypothetical protein
MDVSSSDAPRMSAPVKSALTYCCDWFHPVT